jgi:hypothetical protein
VAEPEVVVCYYKGYECALVWGSDYIYHAYSQELEEYIAYHKIGEIADP